MCQFVPNFVSYDSAKYYLNWFTAGKVIVKIKRVKFLLRHSLCDVGVVILKWQLHRMLRRTACTSTASKSVEVLILLILVRYSETVDT